MDNPLVKMAPPAAVLLPTHLTKLKPQQIQKRFFFSYSWLSFLLSLEDLGSTIVGWWSHVVEQQWKEKRFLVLAGEDQNISEISKEYFQSSLVYLYYVNSSAKYTPVQSNHPSSQFYEVQPVQFIPVESTFTTTYSQAKEPKILHEMFTLVQTTIQHTRPQREEGEETGFLITAHPLWLYVPPAAVLVVDPEEPLDGCMWC